MHQIYSCSDENLEVFTTVISSKSCSPARRRAKSTQHILTKSVVAVSDRRPHRTEKLQPHQGDLLRVLYSEDEVRGLGCLQSGQRGPCPAKGAAQHNDDYSDQQYRKASENINSSVLRGFTGGEMGITERESSKSCNHLLDGKSLFPPSPVAHTRAKAAAVADSPAGDVTPTEDHGQHWRKTAEYDLTLPPGAEVSLPLTGGNLCGTPSLLRKMWMKHKKKSEYLGATNSAFEAD